MELHTNAWPSVLSLHAGVGHYYVQVATRAGHTSWSCPKARNGPKDTAHTAVTDPARLRKRAKAAGPLKAEEHMTIQHTQSQVFSAENCS